MIQHCVIEYALKYLLKDFKYCAIDAHVSVKKQFFFVTHELSDQKQTYFAGDSVLLAGVDHHDT